MTKRVSLGLVISAALLVSLAAGVVLGNNKWNDFHHERTANPFMVNLGDNVTGVWDGLLTNVSTDWTVSDVLDTPVVVGIPSGCDRDNKVLGTVQVCNVNPGKNGWLGLASVDLDAALHILAGTALVNDSYFDDPDSDIYDDDNARRHVLCQEVGHILGLDHQKSPKRWSCMNDNFGLFHSGFVSPNVHDYETLEGIYGHVDGDGGGSGGDDGGSGGPNCDDKPPDHPKCQEGSPGNSNGDFGKAVGHDDKGRPNQFEKDLGGGNKRVTFVTWAD